MHAVAARQAHFRADLLEHDDVLQRRAERNQLLDERRQVRAEGEHAIGGLPDHRREMRVCEARIQRVANDAHAHRTVPALHVRLRVPRQDAEMVALRETERAERTRQALAALPHRRIRDACGEPARATRHDLDGAVPLGCVIDEAVECQGVVLHRAGGRNAAPCRGVRGGVRVHPILLYFLRLAALRQIASKPAAMNVAM